MKGLIIINPYKFPQNCLYQAERLSNEFAKLGIQAEIVTNGYLYSIIQNNTFKNKLEGVSFVIYLDKDKYLSAMIEKVGVRLFNSHNAIRVCDDKGETNIALTGKGVNLPDTIFAPLCYNSTIEMPQEFLPFVEKQLGYPLVVKESYGSLGRGVYKADNFNELCEISQKLKTSPHIYQKYLGKKPGYDIRVIVIGGKAIVAMERENPQDFRSNIALGGKGTAIDINAEEFAEYKHTAEKVAKILCLDYCGVDLLVGDNDLPFVCEVNSNAFFKEIEKVSGTNVAKIYAEYVLSELKK